MSNFHRIIFVVFVLEILAVLAVNILFEYDEQNAVKGALYRVEASRIEKQLEQESYDSILLDDYETIIAISPFDPEANCNNDYVVISSGGELYRVEYEAMRSDNSRLYTNVVLVLVVLFTIGTGLYIDRKILAPFRAMSNMSVELAKGNLATPIKEEKNKFFGKFLWGMDMLREKLEDSRQKELEFQRDRKQLILSLSHDIKTPLSAIELYSRALSEGLYDTKEKQNEAVTAISKSTQEIKRYVDEITKASREDFLNLEVEMREEYLSSVIENIRIFYSEKLDIIHTKFAIEAYDDCLLLADKNRLIEVLQNIIENAIKYGDGRSIDISFSDEEDCKLIKVTNTGCTLKQEELPNLFDSFYRGTNSTKQKGNGLGLYICKNLMRKMDGEMYCRICEGESEDGAACRRLFEAVVVVRKA